MKWLKRLFRPKIRGVVFVSRNASLGGKNFDALKAFARDANYCIVSVNGDPDKVVGFLPSNASEQPPFIIHGGGQEVH